jgi:hypothetical protein
MTEVIAQTIRFLIMNGKKYLYSYGNSYIESLVLVITARHFVTKYLER